MATAPDIVRLCVKSIENNVDNLIVLDKKNYTQWVSLPSYIIDRLECGEMSLAHFSDIVRFYLLFVYGGVWLDATCFLSRRIPQDILHKDFWCINGAFKNNYGWKWTSFVMIGKAGNIVSKQMLSFYYEYWKVHHHAITYLFLDCWLTVLYERNKRIMDIINSLPDNGYKVFFLISNLNREYVPELEDKIRNTFFVYKLTYKEPFYIEANEKLSLYGYLLRSNGILH